MNNVRWMLVKASVDITSSLVIYFSDNEAIPGAVGQCTLQRTSRRSQPSFLKCVQLTLKLSQINYLGSFIEN